MNARKRNLIFRDDDPFWANACVGENGDPGYFEYAKGFSLAANMLIESVLKDRATKYSVDLLVYPICFNMRHSVELRLKGLVVAAHQILDIKGIQYSYNLDNSHHLGDLWSYLKKIFNQADDRLLLLAIKLDEFMENLAEVDPTGQTFRYPVSTTSKKHLVEVSNINLRRLKLWFSKAEKFLDGMDAFSQEILNEYNQGSFTGKLSRTLLFSVAEVLPARSEWKKSEFTKLKNHLKAVLGVGSKELSMALSIIQSHYQMSAKIKCVPELLGISPQKVHRFFEFWAMNHNVERIESRYDESMDDESVDYESIGGDGISDVDAMLRDIKENAEAFEKSWSVFRAEFNLQELAGIMALYYFSLNFSYVESYSYQYSRALAEVELDGDIDAVRNRYRHIVEKVNSVDKITFSLYVLSYGWLAEEIIANFQFARRFKWLNDARLGNLTREPWRSVLDSHFGRSVK